MKSESSNFHDSFKRTEKLKVGSDRQFGFVFAVVFFLLATSSFLIRPSLRVVLIVLGLIMGGTALIEPHRLHPLNRQWAKVGLLLNRVMSPLILGVLFFVVFTPMAFILKICRKDILDLKINKKKETYWVKGPAHETSSMSDQF